MRWRSIASAGLLFLAVGGRAGEAVELRLLHATALKRPLDVLLPAFAAATGHDVKVEYGPAGAIAGRVRDGEPVDVVIVTASQVEHLTAAGRLLADGVTPIGQVGIGLYVRRGAPKPDLRTVEAFRDAMLSARSIAHVDPAGGGASGIYVADLLDRLGLTATLSAKLSIFPRAHQIADAVDRGEIAIAFGQISEILDEPRVELAGPLPAPIQNHTRFVAGVSAGSFHVAAARALISYLASGEALAVMRARGFE